MSLRFSRSVTVRFCDGADMVVTASSTRYGAQGDVNGAFIFLTDLRTIIVDVKFGSVRSDSNIVQNTGRKFVEARLLL